jgi:hypothetical protein
MKGKIKIPMTRESFATIFDLIRYRACCAECKNFAPYDDETGKCFEMEGRTIGDNGVLPLSVCNLWEKKGGSRNE